VNVTPLRAKPAWRDARAIAEQSVCKRTGRDPADIPPLRDPRSDAAVNAAASGS
tara:strand:- start:1168 stop:1329 length:162 start_codon:yes stop_codon:yes gene_type:complete